MSEQDPRGGWHVTPRRIMAEATVGHRRARRLVGALTHPGLHPWPRRQSAMSHQAVQRSNGASGGAV
jgi:hypothetical protein